MWQKDEWVVVIGGTFSRSGCMKDYTFTIAQIVEIGLDDLLVRPKDSYARLKFVPKKTCQRIPIDNIKVYDTVRKPQCGDLVYYYYKDWKSEKTTAVSHVLELKKDPGSYVQALIIVQDKEEWVPVSNLLVLDVNNNEL